MDKNQMLQTIKNGLIVSCQAQAGEPLHNTGMMKYMADAALAGGAAGIRCDGADIAEIRLRTDKPVIGIIKRAYPDSMVYITPTLVEAEAIVGMGADVIAFDATKRERPKGQALDAFVHAMRENWPAVLLMADVSDFDEGVTAERLGVDIVATTLSGYTSYTADRTQPDIALVKKLAAALSVPVICEGGIKAPEQARVCLEAGAHAVVVGSAITRPKEITEGFIWGMNKAGIS